MDNLMRAYEVLLEVAPVTNEMNETVFAALYCMLLEEWCKYNNAEITEVIANISQSICEVNAVMGKY